MEKGKMTKAEERGLEALPPRWRKTKDGKRKVDSVLPVRQLYIRAYEQAEKDINKEMMDMMAEIGEKQEKAALADLDYDIRFDPALGFDLGCVSLYHGKDIIATSQVVDAEIVKDIHNLLHVKSNVLPMPSEYKFGDKVKIIIIKDDDIR